MIALAMRNNLYLFFLYHFITCSFNTHGLRALDQTVHWDCPKGSQNTKRPPSVGVHSWCSCRKISGIWELKALENTVLHMQARSQTGSERAAWKRGGSPRALCLQGDESRPAEISSRAPTTGGKVAGPGSDGSLPTRVWLRALGTRPGAKKRQCKSQGTDTYPGTSFIDGDGITQPYNREGRRIKAH